MSANSLRSVREQSTSECSVFLVSRYKWKQITFFERVTTPSCVTAAANDQNWVCGSHKYDCRYLFWDVMPCSIVDMHRCFRGTCCLWNVVYIFTRLHGVISQKTDGVMLTETVHWRKLAPTNQTARCHKEEIWMEQDNCWEDSQLLVWFVILKRKDSGPLTRLLYLSTFHTWS